MTIREPETIDLATPTGPMRTYVYRPTAPGRYLGLLLFSEIFQVTAPIRRTAALLAGHGFVVAVPEIYHEFEPAGTVLAGFNKREDGAGVGVVGGEFLGGLEGVTALTRLTARLP